MIRVLHTRLSKSKLKADVRVAMASTRYSTLEFDLKKVVRAASLDLEAQKKPTSTGAAVATYEDGNECCFVFLGFGVVFTASLWDYYYRLLRLGGDGCLAIIDVVDAADIMMRTLLGILVVLQLVEFWMMRTHPDPEMDIFVTTYWCVSTASVSLYTLERLWGRYSFRSQPPTQMASKHSDSVEDTLPLQIINRHKFNSVFNACIVTAIYVFVAVSFSVVFMTHATSLSMGPDAVALTYLAFAWATDVVYAFARMPRFRDIATQGWVAANLAGFHTLLTLVVLGPMGIVFLAHSSDDAL